jgi:hypothetical protein
MITGVPFAGRLPAAGGDLQGNVEDRTAEPESGY